MGAEAGLAADYLDDVEVQHISPAPQEVWTEGNRQVSMFAIVDSVRPIEVNFSLKPRRVGRLAGEARIPSGTRIDHGQLI